MKVLFVAEDCPCPPDNGGRLRTFHLLKRLSLEHEITLVAPCLPWEDPCEGLAGRLQRVIPVMAPRRSVWHMLSSLRSPQPYVIRKHESREMKAAVRDALAGERFDLIHCDSVLVASAIPTSTSVPKALNAHNVEAVIWQRYLASERRPWMIPFLRSQVAKVVAYESQLYPLFDCCIAVSELDREEILARYGHGDIWVVGNGVDTDFYTATPDPLTSTIGFIGSLDYRPNKDAVRWFLDSIWPRIRAERPETRMVLVGRRPPHWVIDACARAGISLHADVPDTRPYLADMSLVVSPIRIGSGTRLKILEAMAVGRCVVSTSVGAEGLGVHHGNHIVIADDPTDFARRTIALLDDAPRRQGLAAAGRAFVETRYGWDLAAQRMSAAWQHACRMTRFGVSK